MMDIREKLPDKPDRHKKIVDDEIAAKWRQEALEIPDEKLYSFTDSSEGKKPINVLNQNSVDYVS